MNTKAETKSDATIDNDGASSADDAAAPSPATAEGRPRRAGQDGTLLEMRQVAGLTAGSVMELRNGSFQFRESDKEVGFSLVVDGAESVTVIPGSATASIDEIELAEATPLGASVLNVGSACFTVREPRPEPTNEYRMNQLEAARRPPGAINVPVFPVDEAAPTQVKSSRFGSLFSRGEEETEPTFDAETWQFLEAIRDTRSIVADRHRRLHPDPEELNSRLTRLDPGLWDRTVDHPMFTRFPIAFSTIPWEPRFDEPERIPETLYGPIQEMSCLPWVPITANLLFGPVGIVGGRQAVLSCARNAVLSLACLTSPSDIEFSIVTAQGLVEDWNWSSSLPNSLFPAEQNKYCVAVADGMSHFEGAGFSHESVKENEMGLIVLAESTDDLPDYCGTIIELSADGQCLVTNHLGEQVNGTPIGVTVNFAATLATMIRDAVGDGPADETDGEAPGDEPQVEQDDDPGDYLVDVVADELIDDTDTTEDTVQKPDGDQGNRPTRLTSSRWEGVPPIDDLIDWDEESDTKRGKQTGVIDGADSTNETDEDEEDLDDLIEEIRQIDTGSGQVMAESPESAEDYRDATEPDPN